MKTFNFEKTIPAVYFKSQVLAGLEILIADFPLTIDVVITAFIFLHETLLVAISLKRKKVNKSLTDSKESLKENFIGKVAENAIPKTIFSYIPLKGHAVFIQEER